MFVEGLRIRYCCRYVVEALVLGKPSIFQRICYSATWMPFPFPHIDIFIKSQGYDLGEVCAPATGPSICCAWCGTQ